MADRGIAGSNSDWSIYNQVDLPYSFEYPATWSIDDNGLRQANQEILVIPPDAEVSTTYSSVLIDDRTLEQIQGIQKVLDAFFVALAQFM